QNWGGPADLNWSRRFPHFSSTLLVVRRNERCFAFVFVALDVDEVVKEHWRRTRAEAQSFEALDNFPGETARKVIRVKSFGAEIRVDHAPVGDGRRPGKTAAPMTGVVDGPFI